MTLESQTFQRKKNSALFFDPNTVKKDLEMVLQQEAASITELARAIPESAIDLVQAIVKTSGRVVFSGMGKSGLIARKLVATFSSMGTPALFVHPSEALHGDLGMIQANDLFVALSKSGTGIELEKMIPVLRASGNKTHLICCRNGVLGTMVDHVVQLPFQREACALNLAPTSSSTLMIAFGDALSVAVSKVIGFSKNDFARVHPAGALGKQLLSQVHSFMHSGDILPLVLQDATFQELLAIITSKTLGVGIVVDAQKKLLGLITDGDLRRACESGPEVFKLSAADIMTANPQTITPEIRARKAFEIMEEFNITSLIVTQDDKAVGLLHIHDLIKAGIK